MKLLRFSGLTGLILIVSISTTVFGQEQPHGAPFQEAGNALMCQCGGCSATVATCAMEHCHSSEPIREEIWERLKKGDSVISIVETFKERYGLVILSAPPTSGFHLTAWVAPFLVLFVGAFFTRHVLKTWKNQTVVVETSTTISDAQRSRIEKELRDLR